MAEYYGDPAALKDYNKNLESLKTDDDADGRIRVADSVIRPVLEGHLYAVFKSWPAGTGRQVNAISTLWLHAMATYMQSRASSTQAKGPGSRLGKDSSDAYVQLLKDIKRGTIIIPGAVRLKSFIGGVRAGMPRRTVYSCVDEPIEISDLFPRGLREGQSGKP